MNDFQVSVETTFDQSCPWFPKNGLAAIDRRLVSRVEPTVYSGASIQGSSIDVGLGTGLTYFEQDFFPDTHVNLPPRWDHVYAETYVVVNEQFPYPRPLVPHQVRVSQTLQGWFGNSASTQQTVGLAQGWGASYEGHELRWWPAGQILPVGIANEVVAASYFKPPSGGYPQSFPAVSFPWGRPQMTIRFDE